MRVSLNIQKPQDEVPVTYADVVVVGAGPYGLSTAAHLLAKGLKVAIFGRPLSLWRENMPKGMLLRSFWWASNLSDPQKKYNFEHYFQECNVPALYPLPIETFIDYGLWFQKQCVPNVDETFITSIEDLKDRFEITLEDGRIVHCRVVVMAPGLHYYFYSPAMYDHLSPQVVSHTAVYQNFDAFAGKRVAIIGGGQSALETAALLHESGANVHVLSRHSIHWLNEEKVEGRSLWARVRYPKAGIAPGWFNWGIENAPYIFQQLPRATKDRLMLGRGRYGPAGADWLKRRIFNMISLRENIHVNEVQETAAGAVLKLSDATELHVDHIMLATGYRVNIWKLPMLHATLVSRIQTYRDAPILNNHFESNIPGLYFVGLSAMSSFGPFYRFVVGTDATARRVANAVAHQVVQLK